MADLYVTNFYENTQFYENEGHTHAQTHYTFYTSLAPSAASWDTSSDKRESQLKFFNLEKLLHVCMRIGRLSTKRKTAACILPSHFQVTPVGFPNVRQR